MTAEAVKADSVRTAEARRTSAHAVRTPMARTLMTLRVLRSSSATPRASRGITTAAPIQVARQAPAHGVSVRPASSSDTKNAAENAEAASA
jgi:hypothetical protein